MESKIEHKFRVIQHRKYLGAISNPLAPKPPLKIENRSINDNFIYDIIQRIDFDKNYRLENISLETKFTDAQIMGYDPKNKTLKIIYDQTEKEIEARGFCLFAGLIIRSPQNPNNLKPNPDIIQWYQ